MGNNSINIDLNDPRTVKIASAISNKTSKKILGLLVESELSEGDLAKKLSLPINTIEYNLKILIESGLIEKSKKYFWSVKGKRISVYRISNKKIVISPKKMIKGVFPAVLVSGLVALVLKAGFVSENSRGKLQANEVASSSGSLASKSTDLSSVIASESNLWIWFFSGALFSLIIYLVWNFIVKRFK
jgi:DNA-binding transcriptional ArsR family regulator